jgi:putative Mg2+ transporter-C (MgtC) family protein
MLNIPSDYVDLAMKLLLATFLSGLIGLEREYHGRPAGLRTHILVCLGATIIVASSMIVQNRYNIHGSESVFRIDPWRISAGIVTGIGFLGGGTILKSGDLIRGLTTAAGIWFVAAIGIVVGLGLYIPAAMGTIVGFIIIVGFNPIGHRIPSVRYSQIKIISKLESTEEIEDRCLEIFRKHSMILQNISISADENTEQRILTLFIRSREIKNKHLILRQILDIPHVERVDW